MPTQDMMIGHVHHPADRSDALRSKLLELEYQYCTKSSFHSDDLRNKFIEFYLLIASAAGSAIVGLAELQSRQQQPTSSFTIPVQALSLIAFLIGALGIVMLPIFARLRRVVLECLQGTVLLKRYVKNALRREGDESFSNALLWDGKSLPTDERYLTASFILVFVFMLLDTAMFALSFWLMQPSTMPTDAAVRWTLAIVAGLLTLQVTLYRLFLWSQIRTAMDSDRLKDKWQALKADQPQEGKEEPDFEQPAWASTALAFLVGSAITGILIDAASQRAPFGLAPLF